jgi:hypothetical protein
VTAPPGLLVPAHGALSLCGLCVYRAYSRSVFATAPNEGSPMPVLSVYSVFLLDANVRSRTVKIALCRVGCVLLGQMRSLPSLAS